jgi:DNA repair protein RecO (recombination protein O)
MLNKTKAIVLHHVKYGDSSIIVTLYTENFGRIACMVNGIRSKKTRFPAVLFQPLSLLEIDLYYRQTRGIQRIKEANCTYHFTSIPFNIIKSTVALFLAEVLFVALREEESNPGLFAFLFNALQLLDTKDSNISSFHPWFMVHLTRYLGFYPFHYIAGTESAASDTEAFLGMGKELVTALQQIGSSVQSPPDLASITTMQRNELLERIISYYSLHIEGFSRLHSFKVLREVFIG